MTQDIQNTRIATVLVVECNHETVFIDQETGQIIGRIQTEATKSPEPVPLETALSAERVFEFNIRRSEFRVPDGDLLALRSLVKSYGDKPLRILDTFGWSGEVALACFRGVDYENIFVGDDFTGTYRSAEMQAAVASSGSDVFREAFTANLGPLIGSAVHLQMMPAMSLLEDPNCSELDLVVVDPYTAMLPDLLERAIHHAGLQGAVVGFNAGDPHVRETLASVAKVVPVKLFTGSGLWKIEKRDWLEAKSKLNANEETVVPAEPDNA